MMLRVFLLCSLFVFSVGVSAQSLLIKPLDSDTLNRWMQTTQSIKPYATLLDAMHATEAEALAFEALSAPQQDKQVNAFLKQKQLDITLNALVTAQGWKSVGDYMRISSKIGNAIAAYFQEGMLARLPPEQAIILRENTDPAIKAVPDADLAFVRDNIASIETFMRSYSTAE